MVAGFQTDNDTDPSCKHPFDYDQVYEGIHPSLALNSPVGSFIRSDSRNEKDIFYDCLVPRCILSVDMHHAQFENQRNGHTTYALVCPRELSDMASNILRTEIPDE